MESLVLALLLALVCSVTLTIGLVLMIDAVLQIFGRIYGFGQNDADFRCGSTSNSDKLSELRAYESGQNDSGVYTTPRVRPPYAAF
jgi:hypothetical protein